MENRSLFLAVFVLLIYIILGGVVFHFLERDHEEVMHHDVSNFTAALLAARPCLTEEDVEALAAMLIKAYESGIRVPNNESRRTNWDVVSSTFFSVTVVTTIGYGNISPTTGPGRIFFIFYAIVGIPLCLVLLANVGAKLSKKTHELMSKLKCCEKRPKLERIFKVSLVVSTGVVLLMFIPAVIFSQIEGWAYSTSFYYCVVSLSTVGFGDYVPGFFSGEGSERGVYRIATCFWLFIGLAWLSGIISQIQELFAELFAKSEELNDPTKKQQQQQATDSIDKDLAPGGLEVLEHGIKPAL